MKPSIGKIVHYVANLKQHMPAIIVSVVSDTVVNLQVFNEANRQDQPHGGPVQSAAQTRFDGSVNPAENTWHWPERE